VDAEPSVGRDRPCPKTAICRRDRLKEGAVGDDDSIVAATDLKASTYRAKRCYSASGGSILQDRNGSDAKETCREIEARHVICTSELEALSGFNLTTGFFG